MNDKVNLGKVKCPFCHKMMIIDEKNQMFFNDHYYHNECFLRFSKNGQNLIDDKRRLMEYVSKVFDEDYMEQKFSLDLKFLLKRNFTYQGILSTIIYYREIKKQKFTNEYGITTVRLVYFEAKKYYETLYNAIETLGKQLISSKLKTVTVEQKDDDSFKKYIDISNL